MGKQKVATFTTAAGVVSRRSVSMPKARAESFAKCLSANGRFAEATVHESKPGSARYFVAFRPAKETGQDSIFLDYQQEQINRAVAEMARYDFVPSYYGGAWVQTLPDEKTAYRNVYYVTEDLKCDCPHYVNRLLAVGCVCKHGAAWYAKRLELERERDDVEAFIANYDALPASDVPRWAGVPTPKVGAFSADFERQRDADFG